MKYSAVIALAHLMDQHGKLNGESMSRMDVAIGAFKNKEAPLILTCGWAYRSDSHLQIAKAMKTYAINYADVEESSILTELNSRDTVGDAVFSKLNFATKLDWKKILVVTSDYHTTRTLEIFRFVYGPSFQVDVRPAPSTKNQEILVNETESLLAFRKTFAEIKSGDDVAIFHRLRERHPFYNGEVHPLIGGE